MNPAAKARAHVRAAERHEEAEKIQRRVTADETLFPRAWKATLRAEQASLDAYDMDDGSKYSVLIFRVELPSATLAARHHEEAKTHRARARNLSWGGGTA